MPAAPLPENGDLQIGSLRLPEGCRTHVRGSRDGSTPPVAWVTITPVPDPGAVWAALSQPACTPGWSRLSRDRTTATRTAPGTTASTATTLSIRPTWQQSTGSTRPLSCAPAGTGARTFRLKRARVPFA